MQKEIKSMRKKTLYKLNTVNKPISAAAGRKDIFKAYPFFPLHGSAGQKQPSQEIRLRKLHAACIITQSKFSALIYGNF